MHAFTCTCGETHYIFETADGEPITLARQPMTWTRTGVAHEWPEQENSSAKDEEPEDKSKIPARETAETERLRQWADDGGAPDEDSD